MSDLAEIELLIESLLAAPLYAADPSERESHLLSLLKKQIAWATGQNPRYRNYVEYWPGDFRRAQKVSDLPYLPVSVFKAGPPLSLVPQSEFKHMLTSSSTTGQAPSRVVLDASTARRMTKGIVTIIRDFIGAARRPYLVIDVPENLRSRTEMGARGAAIQGLQPFATESVSCLVPSDATGSPDLDVETLLRFAKKWSNVGVLVYGFTFVIWTSLVKRLEEENIALNMPNVFVLHSGGWKRLAQQSVTKELFNAGVAAVFGCKKDRIIDFYGMVENVGVVYPDCGHGNKHVPVFADVIIRDPLTLAPVQPGQQGLVQVCSALPTSFPGFLLLTDDVGEIIGYDGCACRRRGTHFRFVRRVPKIEVRGCGNLEMNRAVAIATGSAA